MNRVRLMSTYSQNAVAFQLFPQQRRSNVARTTTDLRRVLSGEQNISTASSTVIVATTTTTSTARPRNRFASAAAPGLRLGVPLLSAVRPPAPFQPLQCDRFSFVREFSSNNKRYYFHNSDNDQRRKSPRKTMDLFTPSDCCWLWRRGDKGLLSQKE